MREKQELFSASLTKSRHLTVDIRIRLIKKKKN